MATQAEIDAQQAELDSLVTQTPYSTGFAAPTFENSFSAQPGLTADAAIAQGNQTVSSWGNAGYGSNMGEFQTLMQNPEEVAKFAALPEAEQAAISANLEAGSTGGFDMSTSDMIGLGNLAVAGYGAWDTAKANKANLGLARDARDDRRKEYADSRKDRADRQASWA